jgi:hypothetical protein
MRARAKLDATTRPRVLHRILEQRIDGEHDLIAVEQRPPDPAFIEHEIDIEEVHPARVDLFEQRVDVRGDNHRMIWRSGSLEQQETLQQPGHAGELAGDDRVRLLGLLPRPRSAPSQHLDATFRVETGKITAINLTPR